MLYYTKEDMQKYQQIVWLKNTKIETSSGNTEKSNQVTTLIDYLMSENILLDNKNSIFNYNTSKQEDSFILDFIHGNSVIFGSGRRVAFGKENVCYFCNESEDCPEHQLLYCRAVSDQSQEDLISEASSTSELMVKVLASTNKDCHLKFINRIKDLIYHHNSMDANSANE